MMARADSISSGPRSTIGARVFLALFFAIFLVTGAAFEYSFFIRPLMRIVAARAWSSATCEILSSSVHESAGDDGSTYRVQVRYRYDVDGANYVGDRYKFMTGSSSGRAGKAAIVAALRPGTRTPCYVNPADPSDAVIERGFTADMWFSLLPMLFVLVGGVGLYYMIFGRDRITAALSSKATAGVARYSKSPGPRVPVLLRPKTSRRAKLSGLTIIALVWNGGVAFFLVQVISAAQHARFMWLTTLFLIPFVLVGLFVIGLAVQQALAMSNPLPRVTVSSSSVALGDEIEVSWSIDGRLEKLRRFAIDLEGREEATYRRGTTTSTDREVFAALAVVEQISPAIQGAGSARVTIPRDSMHSFEAPNNKITWVLRARGEIPSWPDSDEEFQLTVAPHR
jgi:hypothetical protein